MVERIWMGVVEEKHGSEREGEQKGVRKRGLGRKNERDREGEGVRDRREEG